jgi:hypothetical protein
MIAILATLQGACAQSPAFNAQSFKASYEQAFRDKDAEYFENLFSKDFWVGNQYKNREQALRAIRQMFEEYADLQADFEIKSVKVLPGKKSLIMNARMFLQGHRASDGQAVTINEVVGGAIYVFERGAWRLYKTVEKTLSAPN